MELLKKFDEQNYKDTTSVFEKYTIRGIIVRDGKIAMQCSSDGEYKIPGGGMEAGETYVEALAREVKEETNIDVQNVRYVGSQAWPFPDQLMLAFTADYKAGQIKIQESELTKAAWFEKDALPPQDQLPRPGSVAWNLISGKFNN